MRTLEHSFKRLVNVGRKIADLVRIARAIYWAAWLWLTGDWVTDELLELLRGLFDDDDHVV